MLPRLFHELRLKLALSFVLGSCGRAPLIDEPGAFYTWDLRSIHCAAACHAPRITRISGWPLA